MVTRIRILRVVPRAKPKPKRRRSSTSMKAEILEAQPRGGGAAVAGKGGFSTKSVTAIPAVGPIGTMRRRGTTPHGRARATTLRRAGAVRPKAARAARAARVTRATTVRRTTVRRRRSD